MTVVYMHRRRTAPVVPVWTPADLGAAVIAWYDAAEASTIQTTYSDPVYYVDQWNDRSGNDIHVTQLGMKPQYGSDGSNFGGIPVVDISGDNGLRSAASALLPVADGQDVTLVLVWRHTGTSTAFRGMFSLGPTSSQTHAGRSIYSVNQSLKLRTAHYGTEGDQVLSGKVMETASPHFVVAQHAGATDIASIYYDGALANSDTVTMATPSTTPVVRIGNYAWDSTLQVLGFVAEAIVLDTVLSSDDRQKLEGYLAHKWGLTGNLPGDHPYKSAAPTA